jgi:hypothetical protein
LDEDAGLRANLAALGPGVLADLRRVLEGPATYRTAVLRALIARPSAGELSTVLAIADTEESVRLRLLRIVRDVTP